MEYIAVCHKEKKSDFGVSFPDFPGCITAGKTLHDAMKMAREALQLHIEGMVEDGDDLPEPTQPEDIDVRGGILFAVEVRNPGKFVRINITVPESALSDIDILARKSGMSRSGYIVSKARGAS